MHLGCGKHRLDGFIHVDLADYPHIEHKCDVRRLPMFADEQVDLIYASHVLEYFDEREIVDVLGEWRRALKPGGVLQVAVPDLKSLIDVYQSSRSIAMIIGPLYGRMRVGNMVKYHKSVWDFASLSVILRSVGFRGIVRQSQPWYPELDDCSNAVTTVQSGGVLRTYRISLNMEAYK